MSSHAKLFYSAPICFFLLSWTLASSADDPRTREYWIAAQNVIWDYAPSGVNKIKQSHGLGEWGRVTRYAKYRYIQYTDASYTTKVPQPKWMGILGPQIRAVVDDTIIVHFKNNADKPLSMHPHGVRYTPENDGAFYDGTQNFPGAKVMPGDSFTYIWHVDKDAGPGIKPLAPSSVVWVYHSHVDSVTEIYDGLIGSIIITRRGWARNDGANTMPKDIDKEFTTLFMVFNEEDDAEGGLMHAMNGYIFGNLEGYVADRGDRVRWHLIGMGTEVDLHTAHWHGKTILDHGRRTDTVELLPTSMKSVTMVADNPGTWLYHCHVTDHITAGMITTWTINP